MRNFSNTAFLVAFAGLQQATKAQLPQSCFLHGAIHGNDNDRSGDYVSNLPMLELYYDPEMKLSKITSYLTADGEISGIQVSHEKAELNQKLDLNIVGEESSSTHDKEFDQPPEYVLFSWDSSKICDIGVGLPEGYLVRLTE